MIISFGAIKMVETKSRFQLNTLLIDLQTENFS
jgi:hypothetical protein